MTSEAIAAKDERIRELEEQLKKHESPTYSVVAERNAKIAELEKRNQELRVKIGDERQKKNEALAEVTERDRTIAQLRSDLREQKKIASQLQSNLTERRNQDFTDCAEIVAKLKKICPQKKVVDLRVVELQKAIELVQKADLPDRENQ